MQKIANENDGFNYFLVGVDVFSRMMFATPVKTKSSTHMITAFNRLLAQMPKKPWRIYSDKGKEFIASAVVAHLDENGIDKITTQSSDVKAAVAERAIRTIKGRLYKYFTQEKTVKFVKPLLL